MDDKALMEDILLTVKGATDLYLHGTIESSTSNIKSTFNKVLNETLAMQSEIYNKMSQKGWYPTTEVEQQKIQSTKDKYSSK